MSICLLFSTFPIYGFPNACTVLSSPFLSIFFRTTSNILSRLLACLFPFTWTPDAALPFPFLLPFSSAFRREQRHSTYPSHGSSISPEHPCRHHHLHIVEITSQGMINTGAVRESTVLGIFPSGLSLKTDGSVFLVCQSELAKCSDSA